jgi:hypothetical protein
MLWGRDRAPRDGGGLPHDPFEQERLMSTTAAASATGTRPAGKQRVGLVLAGLYSLVNIPSVLIPTPDDGDAPPFGILVVGTVVGLVGVVATVAAWRGSSLALRIAAGCIIVATLTAVPAFFVDVPMSVKAFTGVAVLVTVAAVALMFSGRRPVSVVD